MFTKIIKKYTLYRSLSRWKKYTSNKGKKFKDFDGVVRPGIVGNFEKKIKNNEKIAITPLLKKIRYQQKFKKDRIHPKKRELYTAFGITSAFYSFVNYILTQKYEKILKNNKSIDSNILAYRELKNKHGKGKSNIEFAGEVFEYIRKNDTCLCLTFDVKNFFPSIQHDILISKLKEIVVDSAFENEIMYVLKNVLKFSYVDVYKYRHIKIIKGKKQKSKNKFYSCFRKGESNQKRKKARKLLEKTLITKNKENFCVPQGVSLSGTLSNIYMLDFDKELSKYAKREKCLYKRYSDDLIFIKPLSNSEDVNVVKNSVIKCVSGEMSKVNLKLNEEKTKIVVIDQENVSDKKLNYLGFQFDGNNVYISPSTISGHYSKKRNLARKIHRYFITENRKSIKNTNIGYKYPSYGSLFRWVIKNKKKHLSFDSYVQRSEERMCLIGSKIQFQLRKREDKIGKINRKIWEPWKYKKIKYYNKKEKKDFRNIK